jgi:hypothetical protein
MDNLEDEEGSDVHKLIQIAQAIHKNQLVTISIQGRFRGNQGRELEVLLQKDDTGPAPENFIEVFQETLLEILELPRHYGTERMRGAYLWTPSDITRDELAVSLAKEGKGVELTFGPKVFNGLRLAQFPVRYRVQLVNGYSVVFGAQPTPTDLDLAQFMINITEPWKEPEDRYNSPWHIFLSAQPWRVEERGEVAVLACSEFPAGKSPNEVDSFVPQCAAQQKTFIDATRPKEMKAMLKFGRDSKWPLKITIASSLDGINSASVTYTANWDGCDVSMDWSWKQFVKEGTIDNFGPLPVSAMEQFGWLATVRKEGNSIRVILYEKNSVGQVVSTPEDSETPICRFYGALSGESHLHGAFNQSRVGPYCGPGWGRDSCRAPGSQG